MIRKFENFRDISDFIVEEIELGKSDPFPIKNRLYKSGDYTCTSFMIDHREVIVSSIVILSTDIKQVSPSRHYKTISDYISQFGIKSDSFLYVKFMEYSNGEYNEFKNVNDNRTLFRKMETISNIIKDFVNYWKIKHVIFNSVDNDSESGLAVNYNKRDKFYELYLKYNNIEYKKITTDFNINGEIISNFYLLII
jgi:hypothetical protein